MRPKDAGKANQLEVQVVHAIPGRVRLRIRGGLEELNELEQRLRSLPEAQSIEVNPRSGSIVVCYPPTSLAEFAGSLRALFPEIGDVSSRGCHGGRAPRTGFHRDLAGAITERLTRVNRHVEDLTGGIDLKTLVPLALLLFSLLGLIVAAARRKKLPTPTWYDLLWFAFNTFVILNMTLANRKDADLSDMMPADQAQV